MTITDFIGNPCDLSFSSFDTHGSSTRTEVQQTLKFDSVELQCATRTVVRHSGVTKGPADPAVRGGAILGGAKSLFEYGTILKT